MTASVAEIARQITQASQIATDARVGTEKAKSLMTDLVAAAEKILPPKKPQI